MPFLVPPRSVSTNSIVVLFMVCLTLLQDCADDREVCVICDGTELSTGSSPDPSKDLGEPSSGRLDRGTANPVIHAQVVTNPVEKRSWPRWSPNGDLLVYNLPVDADNSELYLLRWRSDTPAARIAFTNPAFRYFPVLRHADGQPSRLVYSKVTANGAGLMSAPVDGTKEQVLTDEADTLDEQADYFGDRIVFQRTRIVSGVQAIWQLELASTTIARLLFNCLDSACVDPRFSPDGTKVAYSSNQDGNFDLFVYDLLTSKSTRLTHSLYDERHPSWDPGGERLAHISNRDERDDVWILELASGETLKVLDFSLHDRFLDWHPVDPNVLTFVAGDTLEHGILFIYQELIGT